jgi:hypothetical protein
MKGNKIKGKTPQKGEKPKQFQGSNFKPNGNFVKKWAFSKGNQSKVSQPHFEASMKMKLTPKSWNLESSETSKTLELDFKGQNNLPWGVIYTLERSSNVDVQNGLA